MNLFHIKFGISIIGVTLSLQVAAQNSFPATGNVLIGTTTDNGNKLQIAGDIYQTTTGTIYLCNGTLNVGYYSGNRLIVASNGLKMYNSTSLTDYFSCYTGQTSVSSSGALGFHASGSVNNGLTLYSVTSAPSSSTLSFGNLRNDGSKKAVINTTDFDATSLGGAPPINLYIYPGKETYSNSQANIILAHDGAAQRGNVLVGTATDNGNKLQVNGSLSATGFILPTGAAAGKVLTSDANGNASWQTASGGGSSSGWSLTGNTAVNPASTFLGTTDNSPLAFRTANQEQLRIDASGNIGIGTSTPQGKLAVNGDIYAKKIKVTQTGWADYVFDPSYQLLPIKKLEEYIQQNKHLPDMPATAEVEKSGIDVGDNQIQLLKKVEELTLYIIEQNKKLESLQKEVDELKALPRQKK